VFPKIFPAIAQDTTAVSLQCRPVKVDSDKNEVRIGIAFGDNPPETIGKIADFVEHISLLLGGGRCHTD
jgi:hypothetical protein